MYEKIVTANRGRGGYCMQVNLFFATVMKSLGFELIATGGRVHIDGGPGEWSHQVNLVQINETIYLVDVGFANPALEKYFGIKLTEKEQNAIKGTMTDLK
ncbi:putative Arylamine N-acetyltransferase, pineal gland isozyme NAT-3 [Glarea lozoyensis 74030]|uniref:Putative Arylamine N-acetyltransferase, pineal gland isozyme NAT-3 n=1 Tax=Glarea lozoyensis (strain ATCC 74030 / MF5533) TaxID=1104152 RepID=H0EDU6_GLAL7|nr:putative Arylamine N-acetyltransferase, pineal gland isozyme NAT-3 [Glarea lozoyensis 74030]